MAATYLPLVQRMFGTESFADPEGAAVLPATLLDLRNWAHTLGAGCEVLAVLTPFLIGLTRLRWRRIWALARLSIKEAIRRKVLYVFSALVVVLLFYGWFTTSKPESQVQGYVKVVDWGMTVLLLVSAGLIGAFSIPADIRQQTIHTITTKPVERFEIVLGRFLGFTLLMSVVLFVLTGLSGLYVLRGIHPDAREESLMARDPLYGQIDFLRVEAEDTDAEQRYRVDPENVGREWDYRKYISGSGLQNPQAPRTYAVWAFDDLPGSLGDRNNVRCEFTFDIYRTTKGKENEGINCSFFFETRNFEGRVGRRGYIEDRAQLQARGELVPAEGEPISRAENELSEKYGYYEVQGVSVSDYHTLALDVPAGLIRNALSGGAGTPGRPPLTVRVRCESPTQYVGMARYDLYLRLDTPKAGGDTGAFLFNFFKGSLGLWMKLVLIIGLCVCLSTELGGIISFLCGFFLYLAGTAREFIDDLASKKVVGGGPMESFFRLVGRHNLVTPLEETTATRVATGSDEAFRWVMGRFINMLPDVDRFNFSDRVANGFNVAVVSQDLLPSFLMLVGYLVPWFVLSYYLIESREIAGAH
jgi:hypothetical protein